MVYHLHDYKIMQYNEEYDLLVTESINYSTENHLYVVHKIGKQVLISILHLVLCSSFSINWKVSFPLLKL